MPAGSKTDPPLPKAKPINDGWQHICDNVFKKGKKKLCRRNGSVERGVRQYEGRNSADTKVSKKGWGGGGA